MSARPGPRAVVVSAWAAAVMVAGGFALLSGVPVAIATVGAFRNPSLKPLRWWTGVLSAAYVTALVVWRTSPDPAPSLTQSLHPAAAAGLVAIAAGTAVTHHVTSRRRAARVR